LCKKESRPEPLEHDMALLSKKVRNVVAQKGGVENRQRGKSRMSPEGNLGEQSWCMFISWGDSNSRKKIPSSNTKKKTGD